MSESDGTLSSAESVSSQETSNSTESSDEMEVVGHVEPYAGEPLAHSSDEEEDNEEDQDGLSPRKFSNSPRDFRSFQRV